MLTGSWEGGDRVSASVFGLVQIRGNTISWGRAGSRESCKTTFDAVNEGAGVVFQDQIGTTYITSSECTFTTLKMKLAKQSCTGNIAFLRFTFRPELEGYVAVVMYDATDQPAGWTHFLKR
jgi:hypothetical protein